MSNILVDYHVKMQIRQKISFLDVLTYYGVNKNSVYTNHGHLHCRCPLHDGADNPNGFSYNPNTHLWTCFTQHCGENGDSWNEDGNYRDVFLFIKLAEERKARDEGRYHFKCSFKRALEVASQLSGVPIGDVKYDKNIADAMDNKRWMNSVQPAIKEINIEAIEESVFDSFDRSIHPYIAQRNFDEDILREFQIMYSSDGVNERLRENDFAGRVIVPIRDADGSLVGFSGRIATDDKGVIKKYGKYRNLMNFEKGFVLYNLNRALPFVKQTGEIILVEGYFDVIRNEHNGVYNSVAVMGSSLTPDQLRLVTRYAMNVYLCFDGDEAGGKAKDRIARQLKKFCNVYTMELPEGKDPDDLNLEEFWDAYASALKFT